MIIRTKSAYDYTSVDDRCLTHNGVIVDVGCAGWDWCNFFIGKKRIIGIDPFENEIEGAELFKGLIGCYNGTGLIDCVGDASSAMSSTINTGFNLKEVPVMDWTKFKQTYKIDSISVLKLNIEGAEYPLLNSMDTEDFKMIDQIAVSFHDWINPKWKLLTASTIHLLELNGFNVRKLDCEWGWYLCIKK